MSNQNRGRRPSKGAPAAALLAQPKQPTVVEGTVVQPGSDATSPAPERDEHAELEKARAEHQAMLQREAASAREESAPHTSPSDRDHAEKQRAYREWMAKMGSTTPAQVREEDQEAPEPEEPQETPQERAERELAEWKADYEAAVQAETESGVPLYVVGRRPPRPKWHGRQLGIGDVVPGAHAFPRLETWVNTGIIEVARTVAVRSA